MRVVKDESLTSYNPSLPHRCESSARDAEIIDFGMNQGYPNVGVYNVSTEEPCLPRVYTKKEKQLPRNTSLV